MAENEDNPDNYQAIQEETGFQSKINYAELYMRLYQGRMQLHLQPNDDAAYKFFYNMLGDFRPLFDSIFLVNYQLIIDSFNNDEQYTNMQAKQQMYRLHVAELAALMKRKGVSPQPDTTLQIVRDDTPKNLDEVFGREDSTE
jgi:hypothetical protein